MKKLVILLVFITAFANAQIVNIPDANFKAKLISLGIDSNGSGEIDAFETNFVSDLHVENSNINSLIGISAFTNLNILYCDGNNLTFLDLSSNVNLTFLSCRLNQIAFLNLSNNPNLTDVLADSNQLNGINISNNPNLDVLWVANNNLTTINTNSCVNLTELWCSSNNLTSLDISGSISISFLQCDDNQLTSLNFNSVNYLTRLSCMNNQLSTLNLSGFVNLNLLYCNGNQLTSLNLNGLTNLQRLDCSFNNLTNLDVTSLTNLQRLDFQLNQIASIDLSNSQNLTFLSCSGNQLATLDVINLTNLTFLACNVNNLSSLNVNTLINLNILQCAANQITTLDVSNLTRLITLTCQHNPMTSLDVTNLINLDLLTCGSDELLTLYMKNGRTQSFDLTSSPNLTFICSDDSETTNIQSELDQTGNTTTVFNSYCSFTPGGNHNIITGNIKYDLNNNGCDGTDLAQPNIRIDIDDSTTQGAAFTSSTGNYTFYTQAGSFALTPSMENPSWFSVNPATATIPFADNNNNNATQDFCITANGVHPDVEIVIAPITPARPGFDATYEITYRNKGNQTVSGSINLTFDDDKTDFVSANPNPDNLAVNSLTWNYLNLLPFESRIITFTLNVNSPTETPAVNIGDVLPFTATINPIDGDELPEDNVFNYNQTVVGSYDPNNIICLEGDVVPPSEIGNYLHYVVNFENTGTFQAENIVVKTEINPAQFDINTLQLLSASHEVDARINGNMVEFIFQTINLDSGGHGNVLLKLKSKNTLQQGDVVSKRADIFFDYNFPVDTGLANTTFQLLNTPGFEQDNTISIYPNPATSIVNINSKNIIKSVQLFDVQGRVLQTQIIENRSSTIDISEKSKGIYFLKITSDKGIKVEKLIKE